MSRTDISIEAKCLYALIQSYSGSTGLCWPSVSTLARQMPCETRSIQRWMRELQNKELIEIEVRRGFTNIYHPLVPEDTPDPAVIPIRPGSHPSPDPAVTQTVSMNNNNEQGFRPPLKGGSEPPAANEYRDSKSPPAVEAADANPIRYTGDTPW